MGTAWWDGGVDDAKLQLLSGPLTHMCVNCVQLRRSPREAPRAVGAIEAFPGVGQGYFLPATIVCSTSGTTLFSEAGTATLRGWASLGREYTP